MNPITQFFLAQFQEMLRDAYNGVLPRAAKHLGITEEAAMKRIRLQMAMRLEVNAEAQTENDTITVSVGLIMYIYFMTIVFYSHKRFNPPRWETSQEQLELDRAFMKEFWDGGGVMTNEIQRVGMEILRKYFNPHLLGITQGLIDYSVGYVVAHEIGHIISRERQRESRNVPCQEVADYFVAMLEKEGIVKHFSDYTRAPTELIRSLWVEELCADGIAMDLCGGLNLPSKDIGRVLLSDREAAAIPEHLRGMVYNSFATQMAADLFFVSMHVLDVYFARAFKTWLPFKTHPPSIVRLIFSRCVFRPPEIHLMHSADGDSVMMNHSSALFGGLAGLPSAISEIAMSRLTNQQSNEYIVGKMCQYLRRAYDGEDSTSPDDILIHDIVTIRDPVFRSSRVLQYGNEVCLMADVLLRGMFTS